ncbi:MAG TPA: ATP-binding protein [Polyangiaceae bacterium]|nr:ATP-binding protein [Polyangiaceae bacterium]
MALLALLLVSLLTGLSLLLVSRIFSDLTPSLGADLRWKTQHGALELSQSADLGVLTNDAQQLTQATHPYVTEGDFLYVAFRDASGKLIYENGSSRTVPSAPQVPHSLAENDAAFASWAPMTVEGLPVGSVTLALSKQRLNAGTLLYRRIIAVGLLGAVAALAMALLFVRRYVTPALRLNEKTLLELEDTAQVALASARAKSQFLANMSHEIRTPMNGMFGMLHLLHQTDITPPQRRYIDVITASARSLLTIVNDVLDFSKLDADKYALAPTASSVRDLVQQTVQLFEAKAGEKGLALAARVDDSVPELVVLDADRVRQVLSNLLSNAIKFTPRGSVDVQVQAQPAAKSDSGATHRLEFSVRDTGVGVSAASRERLFQAFSQIDQGPNRAHEGTGLGLAISRKLVELMGGQIAHEQPSDGGSSFRFILPVSAVAPVASASAAPHDDTPRPFVSDRPLLLVDDNEVNLIVAVEILENLGLRVEVASGGRDAIDAALGGDYALILMDCQMPETDGYQATREIRRQEVGRRVPIVAFTAHALEEERTRVKECGMDDIVTKPVDPVRLSRVLSRWLRYAGEPPRQPALAESSTRRAAHKLDTGRRSLMPVLELTRPRPPSAVQLFLDTVPRELERLRAAAVSGDHQKLSALAHKLKGSSGSLGVSRMSQLCDQLQVGAPDLSEEQAAAQVERIVTAHDAARDLLAAEIDRRGELP